MVEATKDQATKDHEYIACCPSYWGSGKTLGEAVRNMLRVGGSREKFVVRKIPAYAECPWVDDFGDFRADIKEGCKAPKTKEPWETVFSTEDGDDPKGIVYKYGRLTYGQMNEVLEPLEKLLARTANPELAHDALVMLADWACGFNEAGADGGYEFSNENPSPEQAAVCKVLLKASEKVQRLKFDEAQSE